MAESSRPTSRVTLSPTPAAAPRHGGGGGSPPDERPAPPSLGVLHGFEEKPGLVADHSHEPGHGGGQVGQQLVPDRDDGGLGGQSPELIPGWSDHPITPTQTGGRS